MKLKYIKTNIINILGAFLAFGSSVSLIAAEKFWPQELEAVIDHVECNKLFKNGRLFDNLLNPADPSEGSYKQFYFLAKPFDASKKSLIYLDGGPGQVTGASVNTLRFEDFTDFNVVYFHPRGIGCSGLPASNKYDKYLRTDYVIDDINQIKKQLGVSSWDIVYGLSYGTIVAMEYANKYPSDVAHIILEAMVNPHYEPKDKNLHFLTFGLNTFFAIVAFWPEFSVLDTSSFEALTKFRENITQGKMGKPNGDEFTSSEVQAFLQLMSRLTYHGYNQRDDFNRHLALLYVKQILSILLPESEVAKLVLPALIKENKAPMSSMRVNLTHTIHDGTNTDIMEYVKQGVDIKKFYSQMFGAAGRYLAKDEIKFSDIRPNLDIDSTISVTVLQGLDDAITPAQGAKEYFSKVTTHAKGFGLVGYGHQRHFSEACYKDLVSTIAASGVIEALLSDTNHACYLKDGFEKLF